MKTIDNIVVIHPTMSDEKVVQIKELINSHWNDFYSKDELAKFLESGFIYGAFSNNEHWSITEYIALINEVEIEKTSIEIIEDVIYEELINPITDEGI